MSDIDVQHELAELNRWRESAYKHREELQEAKAEIERLRETNRRLNRRVQQMEGKEAWQDAWKRGERSGRDWAEKYGSRELRKAMQKQGAKLKAAKQEIERLRGVIDEMASEAIKVYKPELDAKDAEIKRLREERDAARRERDEVREENSSIRSEADRLLAEQAERIAGLEEPTP